MVVWKRIVGSLLTVTGFSVFVVAPGSDGLMVIKAAEDAGVAKAEETSTITVKEIRLMIPKSWKQEEPGNSMRLTQFKVPDDTGEDRTEFVISSFPGGGGGVDANFKRWNDQFVSEGRKVKTTTGECKQGKYHVSDITGTYLQSAGGPFAGGKKTPKPGYRSMSAVLTIPDAGIYFLRLTGPEKTVTAASEAFRNSFGADASKESDYEVK